MKLGKSYPEPENLGDIMGDKTPNWQTWSPPKTFLLQVGGKPPHKKMVSFEQ